METKRPFEIASFGIRKIPYPATLLGYLYVLIFICIIIVTVVIISSIKFDSRDLQYALIMIVPLIQTMIFLFFAFRSSNF
jgi:hypothetical protein